MTLQTSERLLRGGVERAESSACPLYLLFIATRPCFVKFGPLIHELKREGVSHLLIDTGQHYDPALRTAIHDFSYADDFAVTMTMNGTLLERSSQLIGQLEALAMLLRQVCVPTIPVVSGDTLTAGLVPLFWYYTSGHRSLHIEAGLRTLRPTIDWATCSVGEVLCQRSAPWVLERDEPFPESMNSRAATIASDLLFAPVDLNRQNLRSEGFSEASIKIMSSLTTDAIRLTNCPEVNFGTQEPSLRVDLHRRENMRTDRLVCVLRTLANLCRRGMSATLVRTNAMTAAMRSLNLQGELQRAIEAGVRVEEPVPSYVDFIARLQYGFYSALWTDSGGLQEEASVLGVPCLTCRYGTDRPETVWDGTNLLVPPVSESFCTNVLVTLLLQDIRDAWPGLKSQSTYPPGAAKAIASHLAAFKGTKAVKAEFDY